MVDPALRHKFGYEHLVEMEEIDAELRRAGLSGVALHFAAVRQYEERHAADPTFRQKQEAARARGEPWIASMSTPSPVDLLRRVLEEIRDGHNDPRALARQVLEATRR